MVLSITFLMLLRIVVMEALDQKDDRKARRKNSPIFTFPWEEAAFVQS